MSKYLTNIEGIKSTNYRSVDEAAIESLMTSIQQIGVREPVQLFEVEDTKEQFVIAGHHRLEAVRRLQQSAQHVEYKLPVVITRGSKSELSSKDIAITGVISNLMRKDLHVIERARACCRLLESGMSKKEVANTMGSEVRTVERLVGVNRLPDEFKKYIYDHKVRDSVAYKVAAMYSRDSNVGLDIFTKSVRKHIGRSTVKVDINTFADKLRAAKIGETTIAKVIACF